jgi:hypothetical protein
VHDSECLYFNVSEPLFFYLQVKRKQHDGATKFACFLGPGVVKHQCFGGKKLLNDFMDIKCFQNTLLNYFY